MAKIDSLIFDLDGTLWQTKDSYLYAYHKVILNHPEITNIYQDEDILKTLGLTLKEIGEVVFSSLSSKDAILQECLQYSIEYLKQSDNVISDETIKLLNYLKSSYKLFIVSNCPKAYLDTFLQLLNDATVFTSTKSLDDGDKTSNIFSLIKEYNLTNPLFIGDSDRDYTSAKDANILFAYYKQGYKSTQKYDYILDNLTSLKSLLAYNSYKYNILKDKEYIDFTYQDAQVTYMHVGDNDLFGFLKLSSNDLDNQVLFNTFHDYLKQIGIKKIIGPIDYSTWFNYRLAINHFDLHFIPDLLNTSKEVTFLENLGYKPNQEYDSSVSSINYRLWKMMKRITLPSNLVIKIYEDDECYKHIDEIYEISIEAFLGHYLYQHISKEDFRSLYVDSFKVPHPDLIIVYDDNNHHEPVAFSLCYEDPVNKLYVNKTVAIKQKYQNGKVLGKIIDINYQLVEDSPYDDILYHFRNKSNTLFKQVTKHDLKLSKTYKLFERTL